MNILKTITASLLDETLHVFAALSILVGAYTQQRTQIATEGMVIVSIKPDTLKKQLRKKLRQSKPRSSSTDYWSAVAAAREVAPYAFEPGCSPLSTPNYKPCY